VPLPDAFTGHLVEAALLDDESTGPELARVAGLLTENPAAVGTIPAATAQVFAPAVRALLDRLIEWEGVSDEIFEDTLALTDRLDAAAGLGATPAGTPVSACYLDGEAPVVLVLPMEPAGGSPSPAQRLVHATLREFGAREMSRVPDVVLHRPAWLTHPSTTVLAECVALLAATTGLPLPGGNVVAVGAPAPTGFQPLTDEVDAHREAWERDGRFGAFLVPTVSGWSLRIGGEEHTHLDPQHSLRGAATLLFGDAWEDWRRERFQHVLDTSNWSLADLAPKNDPFPEIDTPQINTIVQAFTRGKLKRIILGGGAKSGRRVTATRVVSRLTDLRWQCVALMSGLEQTLTTREEVIQAARAAFALVPPTRKKAERLLVLLGIRPFESGNIGEMLANIGKELDVSVLGLPRYEVGASVEWDTDSFAHFHAINGFPESHAFARLLVNKLPAVLGELTEDTVLEVAQQYPANLRKLCEELRRRTQHSGGTRSTSERLADLTSAERDTVALAAAQSLLGRESPRADLSSLDDQDLRALGFIDTARRGYVALADTSVGEDILLVHDGMDGKPHAGRTRLQAVSAAVTRQVTRELCLAARSDDPGTRRGVAITIRSSRAYGFRVAQQGVEDFVASPDFGKWKDHAQSDEIADTLKAAGNLLGSSIRELCELLASKIHQLRPELSQPTLHVLADVLRRFRTQIEDETFESCLAWLRDAAKRTLDFGFTSKLDTYALLRLLVRLHDQKLNGIVVSGAQNLLLGLDHRSLGDCLLVYRVDQLVERAARTSDVVQHTPLAEHPEVRKLLALPPSPDSFALTLLRLVLWIHFDKPEHWDDRFEPARPVMSSAIAKDSAYDLHLALAQAGDIRVAFVNRVIQEVGGFSSSVARLISASGTSPTETANLLNTIRRLHLHRAHQVLCLPNGDPNEELAEELTNMTRALNDGKGAGLLLAAVNVIDENFRTAGPGFGTLIAEGLGFEWVSERLELDSRTSTRYHLLRQVWASEATYSANLVEAALAIITKTINTGVDPWGPQLALQLGQHPDFGWEMLEKLREKLHDKSILNGMVGLQNAQAQIHYHRLGRALFPHLAAQFSREFDHTPLATNVISSSMSDMVQGAAAAAETLLTYGVPDAGQRVVTAVFGGPKEIETRLGRMFGTSEFATVLRHLARLDPATGKDIVESMLLPLEPEPTEGETLAHRTTPLEQRARQAMYDSPNSGVELLTAVEDTHPGAGKQIVEATKGQRVWRIFQRELFHLQDPLEQCLALRGLAKVGMLPSNAGGKMDTVYFRWSNRISELTSPVRLAQLVRLFLIWDHKAWTQTITHNISYDKVHSRLTRARAVDLAAVPLLAEALMQADQVAEARKLVDLVVELDVKTVSGRLGLWHLTRLHEAVTRLDPASSSWVPDVLADRLTAAVQQSVVYEELRHWQAIGWAAHQLGAGRVPPFDDMDVTPNMARPHLVGWALSAFPESEWRERELSRVRTSIHGVTPTKPAEVFCTLVMQARLGEELLDMGTSALRAAVHRMTFRQIATLQHIAKRLPEIADLLHEVAPEVNVRASKPLSRCEILATDVRNAFTRMPPRRPQP
jgi:uncharacterized membrane protein YfbV (UPF0208 family)